MNNYLNEYMSPDSQIPHSLPRNSEQGYSKNLSTVSQSSPSTSSIHLGRLIEVRHCHIPPCKPRIQTWSPIRATYRSTNFRMPTHAVRARAVPAPMTKVNILSLWWQSYRPSMEIVRVGKLHVKVTMFQHLQLYLFPCIYTCCSSLRIFSGRRSKATIVYALASLGIILQKRDSRFSMENVPACEKRPICHSMY